MRSSTAIAQGWLSGQTLAMLGGAAVLLAAFLAIEARVATPLMPLRLFAIRSVAASNVAGVLWAAAMFAWFFISALYLQLVLGYDPKQVGLAFLPSNLIMAVFSVGISARLVTRYGYRGPLAAGLVLAAIGLALFAHAPVDGTYWIDVFPGMTLLGVGAGMAFNPLLLAAMSDVEPAESGRRLGHGEHRVHDGRRARARDPREPRRRAHRRGNRGGRRRGGRAERGLSGRVHRGRDRGCARGGDRLCADPRRDAGRGARARVTATGC